MTIKLLSFFHTIIHFFVLGSSKIFWKKWGGHLAVKTVQIITKIQSMQWTFLDFLYVTLPVRHNVFPHSISNKRFAKIDKQIEYSWVVDNVYPKTRKDFTGSVLFIMPYLLIQIGKAPVKKLQRHLNSLIPRYLNINILKVFKCADCDISTDLRCWNPNPETSRTIVMPAIWVLSSIAMSSNKVKAAVNSSWLLVTVGFHWPSLNFQFLLNFSHLSWQRLNMNTLLACWSLSSGIAKSSWLQTLSSSEGMPALM